MLNASDRTPQQIDSAIGKMIEELLPTAEVYLSIVADRKRIIVQSEGEQQILLAAFTYLATVNPAFKKLMQDALKQEMKVPDDERLIIEAGYNSHHNLN